MAIYMKIKRKSIFTIIAILIAIGLVAISNFIGVNGKGLYSVKDVKLGLDLAGGVSITYEADGEPSNQEMNDTVEKLKKRVEGYSVESEVYREGDKRINIEIPGVQDVNAVLSELGQPGTLSFKSEEAMNLLREKQNALIQKQLKNTTDENLKKQYEAIEKKLTDEEIEEILNKPDIADVITGNDIKSAEAVSRQDQTTGQTQYDVSLTLTPEGAKKFGEFTEANIGKVLSIVYDNEIVSQPRIQTAIKEGNVAITGQKNHDEAEKLATTIRIGALPVSLKEVRSNVVGAKLGQEAINTSVKAGILGFIVVVVFMVAIYRWAGFLGSLALAFYSSLMVFLISAFQLTLTLEGIAGIALSIGMAIDANIIIFTRIKEEIGKDRDIKNAIEDGFKKAFSAIVDGNITTLIAAIVLWAIASGSIKGFAQMLALGIVLSMFTALTITKLLIKSFYNIGLKNKKLYGEIKPRTKIIDFLKYKFLFIIVSVIIIVAGVGSMFIHSSKEGNALNYSIEFSGGTITSVVLPEDMSLEDIDNKIKPVLSKTINDNDIRAQKVKDSNGVVFKTKNLTLEERTKLENTLINDFKVKKDEITSENISSTISGEMRQKAITSGIVAGILMLIYIWFRFKNIRFGASSVLALVHDCLIILAFYALTRITVGNAFIAVLLTIIGYSINATIVVFDRIRENMNENHKEDMYANVNRSITQSLSRCIYTSLTVAFMSIALYIFGVQAMKDFALPLTIGVIAGTWSSVGISGALYYIFSKKIENKSKVKQKNK